MNAIAKSYQLLGLLLLSTSTILVGCNLSERNLPLVENNTAQDPKSTQLTYGNFIFQEQDNTVLIPLQITGDRGWNLSKAASSSSRTANNLTVNFIFHNLAQNTSNLLLDRPAIISQYQQLTPQAQAETNAKIRDSSGVDASAGASRSPQDYTGKYWLYHIVEADTNQDETLSNQDAIRGYISDVSGNNLTPITPEQSQLKDWFFSEEYAQILLQVRTNPNEKSEFSEQSPLGLYTYDLETQKQKQITPENTKIKQWHLQGINNKFIVLEVISDHNQDNQFAGDDAVTLYLYDLATKTLYPVTAEDSQLQSWQWHEKSNFLLAKIQEDSNSDRVFDETDSIQIVKLNLDRLATQTPILQESLQQEIQQLYQIESP